MRLLLTLFVGSASLALAGFVAGLAYGLGAPLMPVLIGAGLFILTSMLVAYHKGRGF